MGQKVPPGLIKRGNFWHIKKKIGAKRVFRSTGTSDLAEAERFLAHVIEEIRNAQIYGLRPKRTFRQAATRYLKEATKTSIADDAMHLKMLDRFIGDLPLEAIHMGSLQSFIQYRKEQGVKIRTINYALQTVRHILNIAACEWFDETGITWLDRSPRIKL